MAWTLLYHPEVTNDLHSLGRSEAKIILRVIEQRIAHGEPDKLGKTLAGCRRIHTGQTRIVYRVNGQRIEVLIIAVGMRRDNEIHDTASACIA